MADSLFGRMMHPFCIAAHVFCQTCDAGPRHPLIGGTREYRGVPCPLRWDLDQSLVNQYRDRVQVRRMRLKPKSLRLKRNRPAPSERVKDRRRIPACRLQDLLGVRLF